jgi:hypothetical protein
MLGGPGEAAQHLIDRGPANHLFGDLRVAFVVAGQAPVRGEPGKAAFYDPVRLPRRRGRSLTVSDAHEATLLGRLTDDLHGHLQRPGGPGNQTAGEALVGEHRPLPPRRSLNGASTGSSDGAAWPCTGRLAVHGQAALTA